MKLEEQVTSLCLAKKLKDLGVKQESLWYWCPQFLLDGSKRYNTKGEWVYELYDEGYAENYAPPIKNWKEAECFSAFTVAELIEKVEKSANEWACGYNDSGCFYHFVKGERGTGRMIEGFGQKDSNFTSEQENFIDCLAEWIIHLIQKGLMLP